MRSDLTDITLVVDRSGSMEAIQADAEGGVNAFLRTQAVEPGEALLTLVQFDTEYELVHRGMPLAKVPTYRLVPRGSTALLDALGRAINETGTRLRDMAEVDRPGLVVFVVMTDGQENSSKEFSREEVRRMIDLQQSTYSWRFIFLGANQDSFAEAGSMGINAGGTANFAPSRMYETLTASSSLVGRMRTQTRGGDTVVADFTDEEREQMQE